MFRKSRVSSIMKLTNLLEEFHGTQAEYLDIVNYEIARENICGYIFLLSRISQNAEPTEKMQMESKIQDLIYYRDNLQIEDKDNIQKVLNRLIPEYQAEQNNQTAKKN
jgi:DNA polymerase elongation subunit (family B)